MGNQKYKAYLLSYLSEYTCQQNTIMNLESVTFFLGGTFQNKVRCTSVTKYSQTHVEVLSCHQYEEADTRIMANLAYSARTLGFRRAVVLCTDICEPTMYVPYCFLAIEEVWANKNGTFIAIHNI